MYLQRILLTILPLLYAVNAYKILVIFPLPGKSHGILGGAVVKHLANAGHEVTYITPFATEKAHQNVTIMDVGSKNDDFIKVADELLSFEKLLEEKTSYTAMIQLLFKMMDVSKDVLNNPEVQAMLKDKNHHFDLVLAEWLNNEVFAGLPAVFDCPLIWFSTVQPHWKIMQLIDEKPNPAYTTDLNLNNFAPFTFSQRIQELLMQMFLSLVDRFYLNGFMEDLYKETIVPNIEARGKVAPPFEVLQYNATMVLGNSHISLGVPFRLPDSYKAVGGYHIEKHFKPLPKDLSNILNNAANGVIYFSMGSNLKSRSFPTEVKQSLLKIFGELKQTVLWKFEEDLPDRPKNVHIVQWAPQPSILAHNNCILFITHGGLLSTTEAVHFGVPLVGIPIFGDQFANVDSAVKKGFAKRVDLSYNMAAELKAAIDEVLTNPSYTDVVKKLSYIYHDRPATPGAELVHWVQHVIRTNGAPHLRSPALMVPWYQKMYLDVGAAFITILLLIVQIIKFVIKFRGKRNRKQKMM